MQKNSLIRTLRLVLRCMMSQSGQQIVTIHKLSNISRSKCNATTKNCQVIEYDMTNNFLERPYIKCCGEASPGPFYKKSKLSTSLDHQSEILKFVLIVRPSKDLLKYNKTKVLTTYIYLHPLSTNPPKWSNTLEQFASNLPTNCLSVFDDFVILALKGLNKAFLKIKRVPGLASLPHFLKDF